MNNVGTIGHPCVKKWILIPTSHLTRINSKWFIDINVKLKIIKLLGKKWENPCELGLSKGFLHMSPII